MEFISDLEKVKQPFHVHQGVRFQVIPVSPANTHTELQIVCFFDQTQNQNYAGGTAAVDDHFQGAIKRLRAGDLFRGERFETLLLTTLNEQIPAKKLLLMGLGHPDELSLETIMSIGKIALNEAVKLDVTEFCFAPSLKDAGISNLPTDDVSVTLAQGMLKALASTQTLVEQGLMPRPKLKEATFLAGAQHFANAQSGLAKLFSGLI